MEILIGIVDLLRLFWASSLIGFSSHTSRSPWTNEYDPPLDDGTVPSAKLRRLEVAANDAFDTYREM